MVYADFLHLTFLKIVYSDIILRRSVRHRSHNDVLFGAQLLAGVFRCRLRSDRVPPVEGFSARNGR